MSTDETRERRSGIAGVPMVVAVGALLVWAAFVVVLLVAYDADETHWTRLAFVFASVEAIAFAAAGALFGVTVQRERVRDAEARADANARDAANGRALAAVALSDDAPALEGPQSAVRRPARGDDPDAVRRRHADAARRLFPDL